MVRWIAHYVLKEHSVLSIKMELLSGKDENLQLWLIQELISYTTQDGS